MKKTEAKLSYIENRIQKLLSEARALEPSVANHQIEWNQLRLKDKNSTLEIPEHLLDGDESILAPFKHLTSSIYLSVLVYLDIHKLDNYIQEFYTLFGRDSEFPTDGYTFEFDHYYAGEFYCVFLRKIRKFLSVFEFSESDLDKMDRITGLNYLETILKNTGSIISKLSEKPTSEPGVYKSVKSVMEPIFPMAKFGKSNFKKVAKEYKPDILIPELSAAIEYKYAKSVKDLTSTIEQILVDVKGYTGDKDYKIFYAVFYVVGDIVGDQRFKAIWDDYDFPKNWIPFYIVGE